MPAASKVSKALRLWSRSGALLRPYPHQPALVQEGASHIWRADGSLRIRLLSRSSRSRAEAFYRPQHSVRHEDTIINQPDFDSENTIPGHQTDDEYVPIVRVDNHDAAKAKPLEKKPTITATEVSVFERLIREAAAAPAKKNRESDDGISDPEKVTPAREKIRERAADSGGSSWDNGEAWTTVPGKMDRRERRKREAEDKAPAKAEVKAQRKASTSTPDPETTAPEPRSKEKKSPISYEDMVSRFPQALRTMAVAAIDIVKERELRRREDVTEAEEIGHDLVLSVQQREYDRVERLLRGAKTDVDLWRVLEAQVFSVIRRLDLDKLEATPEQVAKQKELRKWRATDVSPALLEERQRKKAQQPAKKRRGQGRGTVPPNPQQATKPNSLTRLTLYTLAIDLAIIGPNYRLLLVAAIRQLRQDFPQSTLSLALLPMLKRLGRCSYVLGASTELYNELISAVWTVYADAASVVELLAEMDNGVVSFDSGTLDLLDAIFAKQKRVLKGEMGENVARVWKMEAVAVRLKALKRWRSKIRKRLEDEAMRETKERESMGELRERV